MKTMLIALTVLALSAGQAVAQTRRVEASITDNGTIVGHITNNAAGGFFLVPPTTDPVDVLLCNVSSSEGQYATTTDAAGNPTSLRRLGASSCVMLESVRAVHISRTGPDWWADAIIREPR